MQRSRTWAVGESGHASRSIVRRWQTRFAGVYGELTSWVKPKRRKVDALRLSGRLRWPSAVSRSADTPVIGLSFVYLHDRQLGMNKPVALFRLSTPENLAAKFMATVLVAALSACAAPPTPPE